MHIFSDEVKTQLFEDKYNPTHIKSIQFPGKYIGWLVGWLVISTFIGYLTPNPFL